MLSPLNSQHSGKNKLVEADEAVRIIKDGDTVATGGFVGIGFAEEIAIAIEKRFLKKSKPQNLTLLYAAGQGDGAQRGLNHFGHAGLVKRVVGGHWGLVPQLQKLATENEIEAYNLPQGVISHMYRDIAAHRPRTITAVGLGTFVDPLHGGGKINDITKEDLVERIKFDGRDYLAYKTMPIDVAILRGTTADLEGNVTMEREALILENLAVAMAAKNSGGVVIVQVERIAQSGSLKAREVKIPGVLVDCIVLSEQKNHWQTFAEIYSPAFSNEIKVPVQTIAPIQMGLRKIIARRAAFELRPGHIVNLGIGMPEGISDIANEEKVIDYITLTAEAGVIGGLPAGGLNFGAATNTSAIIDQPAQFDFYDGGGLDIAFLGMAQADRHGNLNVSKFGPRLAGAGGFINISQNAKKVVFLGTFSAGGLKIKIKNGMLGIETEGRAGKFVQKVDHVTFSGDYAAQKDQPVLYITERCVFALTPEAMTLIEIAPGIDLQKDILSQMDFEPIVISPLTQMDPRIFKPEPMGLKNDLLSVCLTDRLSYYTKENLFFVNFEAYTVKNAKDIKNIEKAVKKILSPLNHKVDAIVNYDNFVILPNIVDDYSKMVEVLTKQFYKRVTRYAASAFLRLKLGDAFKQRNVETPLYKTRQEARKALLEE
ncbi:MAG: acyl CoA:acetate/3-ketoacid CoA transferase [Desulfobacteraceae bacterium]|nr:acyl CoA:acetate/3-ketoacid CoA transferase [Desulfobacteraceae bacterium]